MFHISGRTSQLAQIAQSVLDNISLNQDPQTDDSFTFVVFQIDPADQYRYIVAQAGLAEPEPMFTPRLGGREIPSPRGFRQRERIPNGDQFARSYNLGRGAHQGVLWASSRKDSNSSLWDSMKQNVIDQLETAFNSNGEKSAGSDASLYPSFWNAERVVLDKLRARVRALGPFGSPPIAELVGAIRFSIAESFYGLLGTTSQVRVGVYMFTGDSWVIPGGIAEGPHVPRTIRATDREKWKVFDYLVKDRVSANEHAFDWVHRAGKPVLLRLPLSPPWRQRLERSGIQMPSSGGLCIAPIQYDREDALVSGLLLVSIENPEPLCPAFCFLTARVAQSIPGYLSKLSAAPGFPYWPDAKVARGRNEVLFLRGADSQGRLSVAQDEFERHIEFVVQSMMPDRSRVELTQLDPGLTGSIVYRLDVVDGKGLVEIPRVLKVGDSQAIGDELLRYFRYVHNKPVGGQSRLDVAMCFPDKEWIPRGNPGKEEGRRTDPRSTAAIAYTFVGIDAKAVPWATWAKTASEDEIRTGIRLAMEHLSCWHRRGREETRELGEMLATPSTVNKQELRTNDRVEFLQRTVHYMNGIRVAAKTKGGKSPSCIVHGDLHCNNLFALLGKDGGLKDKLLDVAIIDWGKVESGRHPSTDLAVLLGDLAFRVNAMSPNSALQYLEQHAQTNGLDVADTRIVFCFHLMRMLAWGPLEGKEPWISEKEAESALQEIERILVECGLKDLLVM